MGEIHPRYIPTPYQEAADHGRVLLRDGSTGLLRPVGKDDQVLLAAFFDRLSPESRRLRFFSESGPTPEAIAALCADHPPREQQTLVVLRRGREGLRIIGSGSIFGLSGGVAEFAVAVDDAFHGKGLGGILLERLAVLAVAHGFTRFLAVTHPTNRGMLDVFRNSGFEQKEHVEDGLVHIELTVTPREQSVAHSDTRDRVFTKASIRPLFYPQSVAVVGASKEPGQIGRRILEGLIRGHFSGSVFPVNPNRPVVFSMQTWPTVQAIGEPVDLAVLAVPHEAMSAAVQDCAAAGVRAVIVVSAGYAETGPEGQKRQDTLRDEVRAAGLRMVGPNCLGLINADPEVRLHATFAPHQPKPGKLAVSSQSGALGLALLQLAESRNLGIAQFISMGNKADVTGNDLLYFWEDEPRVGVILLYLDSFGNPRRFARIARHVSRRKPVVCVKSGRYRVSGADALEEHAVAGLFRQAGILRATSLQGMMDVAALLDTQPLPQGRRVALVTNARGAGLLCADACAGHGLTVIDPPGDAAADPSAFRERIAARRADEQVDAIVLLYAPIHEDRTAEVLEKAGDALAGDGPAKPVLAVPMSGAIPAGAHETPGGPLPCYADPEAAAAALAAVCDYAGWLKRPPGRIPAFEDVDLQAAESVRGLAGPLPRDRAEVLLAAFGLWTAPPHDEPHPLTLSVRHHDIFGPVMEVREAGFVEYRLLPLTDSEAANLVEALLPASRQLGAGHRDVLAEAMLRISLLAEQLPELETLSVQVRDGDPLACSVIGVSMRP